jgi:hypothetical protein
MVFSWDFLNGKGLVGGFAGGEANYAESIMDGHARECWPVLLTRAELRLTARGASVAAASLPSQRKASVPIAITNSAGRCYLLNTAR